jgi:uncharacterized protein (DUF58 family)
MYLWKDKRLRLSLTRLGVEYLLVLFLLGLIAVARGNNLLYVIFCLMLGLFLVSGWVSRRSIRDLRPIGIEEGNLFARVKGGLRVRLADEAPRRVRGVELLLVMEGAHVERGFLGGGQGNGREAVVVLQVRAERRGWNRLKGLELATRYPFGFLEKAWRFPLDQQVLVLPHPRAVILRLDERSGRLRSLPRPGSASPDGARPYRTGDPLSRMHWKRTAQRGAPWVRTLEDEGPTGLRLRLDLQAWKPGSEFEKELERLSGAVLNSRIQRREVSLEVVGSGITEIHTGHKACWRALALAEAEGK